MEHVLELAGIGWSPIVDRGEPMAWNPESGYPHSLSVSNEL
jgi:hypothetical protein